MTKSEVLSALSDSSGFTKKEVAGLLEDLSKLIAKNLKKVAQKQSRMRADNALVSFLNGDHLYWKGGFDQLFLANLSPDNTFFGQSLK